MRSPSGRTPEPAISPTRLFDGPDDRPPVGAAEHHDHAADDLACPVLDRAALTDRLAGRDLGHVADEDGRPALRLQRHRPDVVARLEKADAADEILLFAPLEDVPADVEVVPAERLADLPEGEVVGEELLRVHRHMVLLDVAAEGVDLADAGHGLEQRGQDPVLNGPDLGQVFLRVHAGGPVPREGVLIDLAHGRGHRSHGDLRARGDALPGLDQPLEDELAGEIDIDAVLEDDRDDRQPRLGHGADLGQPGQAAHHDLDGIRDEPLHLGRRHARDGRQDLDLDIGHIGEGIDRDARDGPNTQGDEEENTDEDKSPLSERALDQTVNHAHGRPPGPPCGSPISGGSCPT